ncbi:phosphotransferase family protein [Micromonospora sp. NPDC048868]|uniref:phosphotransferase family protein n=1 Tax=Micromonospora sp. NPDC048868 TaxID=3364258 RepID=UPI003719CC0A
MELLPRGYTNNASRHGDLVTKSYRGPGWPRRRAREAQAVRALAGALPVPRWVGGTGASSTFTFVAGVHAQDLIDAGQAGAVLGACGRTLRQLHAVDPAGVFADGTPRAGDTLVHGDYGPNNVLLDPGRLEISGVLDWEWAHVGDPLEDLAWSEWIMRMHHGRHLDALDAFFIAYGQRPAWADRHRMMVAKCQRLVAFWTEWQPDADITKRRHQQLADTQAWTE